MLQSRSCPVVIRLRTYFNHAAARIYTSFETYVSFSQLLSRPSQVYGFRFALPWFTVQTYFGDKETFKMDILCDAATIIFLYQVNGSFLATATNSTSEWRK